MQFKFGTDAKVKVYGHIKRGKSISKLSAIYFRCFMTFMNYDDDEDVNTVKQTSPRKMTMHGFY